MLKGILAFGLTRRPIILLALLVFVGAGAFAFTQAQHRGLSESGAGDPGNHRAGARPVGRGDGALLHDPDGNRPLFHARHRQHPLDLVLRLVLRPRHLQIRRRLLFRLHAGRPQPAAERHAAAATRCRRSSRSSLVGEVYPLPGGRPAAFRPDQSAHRAGLDRTAPPVDRSRASLQVNSWGGTTKEFEVEADLEQAGGL